MHTTHVHHCRTKCLLPCSWFVDMIKRYSIAVDRVLCRSTGWYMHQFTMQNHFETDRQYAISIAPGCVVSEFIPISFLLSSFARMCLVIRGLGYARQVLIHKSGYLWLCMLCSWLCLSYVDVSYMYRVLNGYCNSSSNRLWIHARCVKHCSIMSDIETLSAMVR